MDTSDCQFFLHYGCIGACTEDWTLTTTVRNCRIMNYYSGEFTQYPADKTYNWLLDTVCDVKTTPMSYTGQTDFSFYQGSGTNLKYYIEMDNTLIGPQCQTWVFQFQETTSSQPGLSQPTCDPSTDNNESGSLYCRTIIAPTDQLRGGLDGSLPAFTYIFTIESYQTQHLTITGTIIINPILNSTMEIYVPDPLYNASISNVFKQGSGTQNFTMNKFITQFKSSEIEKIVLITSDPSTITQQCTSSSGCMQVMINTQNSGIFSFQFQVSALGGATAESPIVNITVTSLPHVSPVTDITVCDHIITNTEQSFDLKVPYNQSQSLNQDIQAMNFFINSKNCPINVIYLRSTNCVSYIISNYRVELQHQTQDILHVASNVISGWSQNFCLVASNGVQQVYIPNLSITQIASCQTFIQFKDSHEKFIRQATNQNTKLEIIIDTKANDTAYRIGIIDNFQWPEHIECSDVLFSNICEDENCKKRLTKQNSQIYVSDDQYRLIIDRTKALQLRKVFLQLSTQRTIDVYSVPILIQIYQTPKVIIQNGTHSFDNNKNEVTFKDHAASNKIKQSSINSQNTTQVSQTKIIPQNFEQFKVKNKSQKIDNQTLVSISKISNQYILDLLFDKDMSLPINIINNSHSIFNISIYEKQSRDKDDFQKQHNFTWKMLIPNSRNISFKLNLTNFSFSNLSLGDQIVVSFQIINFTSFITFDGQNLNPYNLNTSEAGDEGIMTALLPQYLNIEQEIFYNKLGTTTQNTIKYVFRGLVISFLLGGAIQNVVGLIRGIQTLSFMTLIYSRLSAECDIFFQIFMQIASLDVYFGNQIVGALFNFSNQNPFNDHFYNYQFQDMNFLNNTGSAILPILVFMVLKEFFSYVLFRTTKRYYRCKFWRNLGPLMDYQQQSFYMFLRTYFQEGFLAFTISFGLQFFEMVKYRDQIKNDQISDIIELIITFAVGIVLVSLVVQHVHFQQQFFYRTDYVKNMKAKKEQLFEGLKLTRHASLANLFIMIRAIYVVFVLLAFPSYPVIQLQLMIILFLSQLSYAIVVRPYKLRPQNNGDVFNFICLLVMCDFRIINQTSYLNDINSKIVCNILILIVLCNVGYHLINLTLDQISQIILNINKCWIKRAKNLDELKTLNNFYAIHSKFPQFNAFKAYIVEKKNKKKVVQWQKIRTWMKKHHLSFKDLEEEKQYQLCIKLMKLRQKQDINKINREAFIENHKLKLEQLGKNKAQDPIKLNEYKKHQIEIQKSILNQVVQNLDCDENLQHIIQVETSRKSSSFLQIKKLSVVYEIDSNEDREKSQESEKEDESSFQEVSEICSFEQDDNPISDFEGQVLTPIFSKNIGLYGISVVGQSSVTVAVIHTLFFIFNPILIKFKNKVIDPSKETAVLIQNVFRQISEFYNYQDLLGTMKIAEIKLLSKSLGENPKQIYTNLIKCIDDESGLSSVFKNENHNIETVQNFKSSNPTMLSKHLAWCIRQSNYCQHCETSFDINMKQLFFDFKIINKNQSNQQLLDEQFDQGRTSQCATCKQPSQIYNQIVVPAPMLVINISKDHQISHKICQQLTLLTSVQTISPKNQKLNTDPKLPKELIKCQLMIDSVTYNRPLLEYELQSIINQDKNNNYYFYQKRYQKEGEQQQWIEYKNGKAVEVQVEEVIKMSQREVSMLIYEIQY